MQNALAIAAMVLSVASVVVPADRRCSPRAAPAAATGRYEQLFEIHGAVLELCTGRPTSPASS